MVKAKVFTGEGKASDFLQKDPYTDFIKEKAGFKPFPGTLNVRLENAEQAEKLKKEADEYEMPPTKHKGQELGGIKVFEVKINGLDGAIVEPELSRYDDNILELLAPVNLRDKLDIDDGDEVKVTST